MWVRHPPPPRSPPRLPSRPPPQPELPIKLRSLLQAVEQAAVNFMEGLALVLSTSTVKVSSRELGDPAKVSSQQLEQGLGFMLRIYEIIFGAQLGPRSKDMVMKLWSRWTASMSAH